MERIRRKSFTLPGDRWKLNGNISGRIVWESRRIGRRLGWSLIVAIACLCLATLAAWRTYHLSQQQDLLKKQLQVMQSRAADRPTNETAVQDVAGQLTAFYAYLPEHDEIPDLLKHLMNIAGKNGVVLSQGEYKPQPEPNADFMRYQIALPVKASYPSLQNFMVNALQDLPTLTLESVLFKRETIESGEVEAKINFILLVKKKSAKGGAR